MCRKPLPRRNNSLSSLERLERQLSTPREIAVWRRHCLGLSVDSSSTSSSRDGSHREERTEVEGGLPVLLASVLEEAVDSWSSFLRTITGRQEHDVPSSSSSSSPRPPIFTASDEVDVLRRTVRLLSSVSRLDPTLGEEIRRAGSFQSVCSRLIGQINKCASEEEEEEMMMMSEEDSDALVDLQDSVFEIYSPSASARRMEFTNEELRSRLPLVYSLTSVSRGIETQQLQQRQGGGGAYDGDNATIFINQVTRRQSAQADVGFVMWPSAIVLSRWLISNPHIISQDRSVLELGAGCGLAGITAARIKSQNNSERLDQSKKGGVIITDVNELVLSNIEKNIDLNDVSSVASVAKLDFYSQIGDNYSPGKWIAGEMTTASKGCAAAAAAAAAGKHEREAVDVILAADIICQPEDAVAAANTIHDALRPRGGVALVVCANAEHRFGVDIFAGECERRGLAVTTTDVADMYDGKLLSEDMDTAAGYIDGMMLTFFEITKQ